MCKGLLFLICFVPAILGALESRYEGTRDTSFHTNGDSVDVKFAPKFKRPIRMHNINKPAGSFVRYKCVAEGNPNPNITWTKNGGPIVRQSMNQFQPMYGKWSLILDELMTSDNGNYTCVVCNELGCISHTYELQVTERLLSAPVLIEGVQNVTASFNETVSLSCRFLSDMHMAIYWTKRSQNATEEHEIVSDNVNDKPEKLTIHNVTPNSEGWFKCIALNALGNATSQGYLKVINKNELDEEHVAKDRTETTEVVEINTHNTLC